MHEPRDNLCESKLRPRVDPVNLKFFDTLPSTNRFVLNWARQNQLEGPTLAVARLQTAGQGRRDKTWESAAGNVAMTFGFPVSLTLSSIAVYLPRLAIMAAAKVVEAIRVTTELYNVEIKWPNDLILNDRKLGGLLIETTPLEHSTAVVLGLGLNVNQPIDLAPDPDQLPPISVIEQRGRPIDLNELVGEIVQRWRNFSDSFESCMGSFNGLESGLWRQGKSVSVSYAGERLEGEFLGINRLGGMELRTSNGTIQSIPTGTLRAI